VWILHGSAPWSISGILHVPLSMFANVLSRACMTPRYASKKYRSFAVEGGKQITIVPIAYFEAAAIGGSSRRC
jgi:hypothetical protein